MKKLILVLAAVSMALLAGCDPAYQIDDNHKIDTGMRLFENGLDFPVGSTVPIRLADILKTEDSENPLLRLADDGTYRLHFGSSEPITRSVAVPSVRLGAIMADTDLLTTYDFPAVEVGNNNPAFSDVLLLDTEYPFSWETDVPSEIVSISEVTLESSVSLFLSSPEGAYTVNRGSTIVFPAYMTITTEDSRLSIADGHTVSLLQDIHIGYGSSTALEFTLTHIDTEGFVKPGTGKLSISGTVGVKGSVTISGADFGKLPASFGMYAKVSATGMDVKELVGRFNVSASTNNVTYTLEGVPESLRNNKIILSDPGMSVTIFNGSPFRLTVNSSITADIDGAESYMMDITDFVLEPEKSNVFSLPKEDARYLTQRIPMRFVMGGTTAVSDSSIPVRVTAGESYTYSVDYAFDAPLAFDSGTDITYTTVLEDVKIDLGTNFRNSDASLDFDIINTLPFDIEIDACVLDGEGNPVTDITVGSPVAIKAGSTASPSTTAANIDMHFSANFNGRIPNIQLTIHGTVPEGFSGTVWNKDQYIKIENAAVHTGPVSIE